MPPPRTRPGSRNAFYPPNDAATYRDVLMFEERLKSNAVSLQRRKSRYQLFLLQLLVAISVLLWEVLLPPQVSVMVIPYRFVLHRLLPSTVDTSPEIHPYISSGLLFVSVTTLLLFFASGMYSEKIAYANKYVPHANRALRSFNMVLNVRKPPLRTQFGWNPLNVFFPRPPPQPATTTPPLRSPTRSSPRSRSPSVSRPMASHPPASNPRGELLFSSKVDKAFREGYERYRATFERKREEKRVGELMKTWWGRVLYWRPPPANSGPSLPASRSGSVGSTGTPPSRSVTPELGGSGIMMKSRGESSRANTPSPPATPHRPRRENMRTLALERSFEHSSRR